MPVELLHLYGTAFVMARTFDLLSKKTGGGEGLMLANGLGKVI